MGEEVAAAALKPLGRAGAVVDDGGDDAERAVGTEIGRAHV